MTVQGIWRRGSKLVLPSAERIVGVNWHAIEKCWDLVEFLHQFLGCDGMQEDGVVDVRLQAHVDC